MNIKYRVRRVVMMAFTLSVITLIFSLLAPVSLLVHGTGLFSGSWLNTSENYRLTAMNLNGGGGAGNSATHQLFDAIGDGVNSGESNSSNFRMSSGVIPPLYDGTSPSLIHVKADASGANNGTSWTNAYTDLQDGLTPATAGDEIWVAAGTYKPTDSITRTISFELKNGVGLYGGFSGTETSREERNWEANVTILSGDLNGDDNDNVAHDELTRADNSLHVVIASDTDSSAILDGFTITGGNANHDYPDNNGGGILNLGGYPTMSHLIVKHNSALERGGGMYNWNGSPAVRYITFEGNSALFGGGMSNLDHSHTLAYNVTFTNNHAKNGGGMHNKASNPTLRHIIFTNNSVTQDDPSSNGNGGGMWNHSSNFTMYDATFTGNSAIHLGGGMYNTESSSPNVSNALFLGNSSDLGGAIFNNESSTPSLVNVIITGNSANSHGGGIGNWFGSIPSLSHVTLTGNSANQNGGGIYLSNDTSVMVSNSILWNNQDSGGIDASAQIHGSTSPVTVTYSLVQGGFAGTGNIDRDPLFISPIEPNNAPTTDGDFHLQSTSPAIDAGDNSAVPTDTLDLDDDGDTSEPLPLDLDGNPRFIDHSAADTGNGSAPIVDLGAYEMSANGSVILALEPTNVTANIGQTFEVTIVVHAGTQEVDGVSAYLNFEPAYLEVVSITPGSEFSTILTNEFDNNTGEVHFAAGSLNNFPSGTFTLATVTFQALALTDNGGMPIEFNSILPRQSDATFNGRSVLQNTIGSTVIISNATLVCSVTLQGRPTPPHSRLRVPLRVSLTIAGDSTPAYTFTPTTDENGRFTIEGIAPGNYELRVKHSHALQNKLDVTLTSGTNSLDCGTLLEGDANDDNFVTILDFSILATTFGVCEGDDGYDERADFNGDGCITILDFSLLASNFGQTGASATAPSRASQQGDVTMAISQMKTTIKPGETFSVTVKLDAGEQPIDGAQIQLNFNPDILAVEEVIPGGQLDGKRKALPLRLELANQFDNENGTIEFAVGTWQDFPSGEIELLQIQFKALEGGETALAFELEGATGSNVTFGGASVMGNHADGVVTVNQPTAVKIDSLAAPATTGWLWALLWLLLTTLAGGFIMRRRWRMT